MKAKEVKVKEEFPETMAKPPANGSIAMEVGESSGGEGGGTQIFRNVARSLGRYFDGVASPDKKGARRGEKRRRSANTQDGTMPFARRAFGLDEEADGPNSPDDGRGV